MRFKEVYMGIRDIKTSTKVTSIVTFVLHINNPVKKKPKLTQNKPARFQFEESVSTFTAGLYSMSPGVTTPSLVYVTFNNKIQVP